MDPGGLALWQCGQARPTDSLQNNDLGGGSAADKSSVAPNGAPLITEQSKPRAEARGNSPFGKADFCHSRSTPSAAFWKSLRKSANCHGIYAVDAVKQANLGGGSAADKIRSLSRTHVSQSVTTACVSGRSEGRSLDFLRVPLSSTFQPIVKLLSNNFRILPTVPLLTVFSCSE